MKPMQTQSSGTVAAATPLFDLPPCDAIGSPPCDPENAAIRSELEIRLDERHRIGRELHDSLSQLLVGLQLGLACLKGRIADAEFGPYFAEFNSIIAELHSGIRSVTSMRDVVPLESGQLPLALEAMANRFTHLTGIAIVVVVEGDYVPQPAQLESCIYRIAQEALANVRHAEATTAGIRLWSSASSVRVTIEDDGVGFNGKGAHGGLGIRNIRYRVRELHGRLSIRRLRRGSRICAAFGPAMPRF